MKTYSQAEEEKIRAQRQVREWRRSGLLDAEQAKQLEAELRTDLRRTNSFFRAVLFVFTVVIVSASIGFVAIIFQLDNQSWIAAVCFVGAVLCVVMAEFLIGRFRVYRFGVEEALACASVALATIGVAAISPARDFATIPTLAAAAIGGLAIYLRFGYLGMALASMASAAVVPFGMDLAPEIRHIMSAVILLPIFFFTRQRRRIYGEDFPGDDYGVLQAVSWAGLYLALNLQIGGSAYTHGLVYWSTYAMTFILPVVGARMALRGRDRPMIYANLAMALVTLITNKPYLGWTRQPWDPILFGLFLMSAAILIKRWLSHGADAERYGFTANRLLAGDRRILAVASTAAAAFQPPMAAPDPAASKPDFGGGRSGGGGASGGF